ncbi:amidohydrolase family protein [Gordonia sp. TBRC 11910]|uniref:Amidohydrolase family protein n=1 Tax=Gordonia asplenii TaxID=2725283 RepID=A0A848L2Z4_9ACTN|nr:amidohydrolase family protein [Gordonia asplenii]NMO05204.1 amidohydrolase family protein [Gordonia asplenii]
MIADYVRPPGRTTTVIADVTVVDVVNREHLPHRDIHLDGDRITAIEQTSRVRGDTVVDAAGRFAVPGFIDAHVHVLNTPDDAAASYALMLANGIVGFRQMSGSPALLEQRARGELPAALGAPDLLATSGALLTPLNANSADVATREVRAQRTQGADFIKAGMASRDGFFAALAEAQRLGLPLAGHLPADVDPREAARRGMACIEHLGPGATVYTAASNDEDRLRAEPQRVIRMPSRRIPGVERVATALISRLVVNPATLTSKSAAAQLRDADATYDDGKAHELAELFVKHRTWQCPTLIRLHTQQFPGAPEHSTDPNLRYIAPDEIVRWRKSLRRFDKLPSQTREVLQAHWAAQLRMTKVFADAGVPMMAGTDANGAGWVVPGFALHQEFDLLASAGVEAARILEMATSAPAEFLGVPARGRIEAGGTADLVLLQHNPLDDHHALHQITGVLRAGHYWDRSELDAIVDRVAAQPRTR